MSNEIRSFSHHEAYEPPLVVVNLLNNENWIFSYHGVAPPNRPRIDATEVVTIKVSIMEKIRLITILLRNGDAVDVGWLKDANAAYDLAEQINKVMRPPPLL
mgnify:FL=1